MVVSDVLKESNTNYIILSELYYFLSKKDYVNVNRMIREYHISSCILNKFIKYYDKLNLSKKDLKTKQIILL